jgi:hypothetical protein
MKILAQLNKIKIDLIPILFQPLIIITITIIIKLGPILSIIAPLLAAL